MIGDEMMDIVAAFPPADRKSAAEVSDEHSHQRIGNEVVSDASMAGIMSGKHDLVLVVICQ